mmetsp:Transcript_23260/g.39107  ORF Transcript_23260/g.39107 Transcript_23260/m.39107 type:complete len:212 (-) Transcript_23260:93-728(-)
MRQTVSSMAHTTESQSELRAKGLHRQVPADPTVSTATTVKGIACLRRTGTTKRTIITVNIIAMHTGRLLPNSPWTITITVTYGCLRTSPAAPWALTTAPMAATPMPTPTKATRMLICPPVGTRDPRAVSTSTPGCILRCGVGLLNTQYARPPGWMQNPSSLPACASMITCHPLVATLPIPIGIQHLVYLMLHLHIPARPTVLPPTHKVAPT